jgi:hypothetical protein
MAFSPALSALLCLSFGILHRLRHRDDQPATGAAAAAGSRVSKDAYMTIKWFNHLSVDP